MLKKYEGSVRRMLPVLEENIRWNNLRKEMVLSVIGKITLLILILVVYMVMMILKAQGMVLCLI